jgi:hypothetical protein
MTANQQLGGLVPRLHTELDAGGVEVAVHGLRGDPQPQADLLAAVALRDVAQAIPLPVGEQLDILSVRAPGIPHAAL